MEETILDDLKFDEKYIESCMSDVDANLIEYVENNIMHEYDLNDGGHNRDHIDYVLKRAFEISKGYEVNYNILYICVVFHDIACHIDRDIHEVLSAERAYSDEYLNNFFSEEEMNIIKEAIEDHRASLEYDPRNIYGKILSSADRKVEVKVYLISSMSFDMKKQADISKEQVIMNSYEFAIKKFGKKGYALNKTYVDDVKYKKFINDLHMLIENKEMYFKCAEIIYEELKNKEK